MDEIKRDHDKDKTLLQGDGPLSPTTTLHCNQDLYEGRGGNRGGHSDIFAAGKEGEIGYLSIP